MSYLHPTPAELQLLTEHLPEDLLSADRLAVIGAWFQRHAALIQHRDHYVMRPASVDGYWLLGAPSWPVDTWPAPSTAPWTLYIALVARGGPVDGTALLAPDRLGDPCRALRDHVNRTLAWLTEFCPPLAKALGPKPVKISRNGEMRYVGAPEIFTD